MVRAMTRRSVSPQYRIDRPPRRGLSLLEVIASTALVAVMMVPIAGVIRASGQAMAQADQAASAEATVRRGLSWLSDAIQDGQVLRVDPNEIRLILKSAIDVRVAIIDGDLVMTDGTDPVVVTENVREIQFKQIQQSTPPNALTGIQILLTADDPVTGKVVTVQSIASIATQY